MPQTLYSPSVASRQIAAAPSEDAPRRHNLHAGLIFTLLTAFTCAWLLSLPLFPSQDGPLHRYYVHVFSELLEHQHTRFTELYAIRDWLPPYATYYYSLVALGRVVSLETADKIFVVSSIVLFAGAGFLLLRRVAPHSPWAPLLLLPVLLNWPTFMGFANYMFSIGLACFAIACWIRATQTRPDSPESHPGSVRRRRLDCALFLLSVLLIVVTHPLPWIFVLGFAVLDLLLRLRPRRPAVPAREPITVALACLPALYLGHFRAATRTIQAYHLDVVHHRWRPEQTPDFFQRVHNQAFSLLHMQGMILFLGHGAARPYRLALNLLMGSLVLLVSGKFLPWRFVSRGLGRWMDRAPVRHLTRVWTIYGCLIALAILLVPDDFGGGYFFTSRLQLLVYLCVVAAAAQVLEGLPHLAGVLAGYAALLSLFTLGLGIRYVTPVVHTILALREIPSAGGSAKPGLILRPVAAEPPANLNFDSLNWAAADYFREHEVPLYNTSWLGEPLIPLRLTPRGKSVLDTTYFNQVPQYGEGPMLNGPLSGRLLAQTRFVLLQRDGVEDGQHPFATVPGSSQAAAYAQGWECRVVGEDHWYACAPPA